MKTAELRKRLADLLTEQRSLMAGSDVLTEEQVTQYDELTEKIEAAQATLERAEALEAREAKLSESKRAVPAEEPTTELRGAPRPEAGARKDDPAEFRSLGEFLYTVARRPSDARLQDLYKSQENREQTFGTDAKGGFAIPDQFISTLMQVTPEEAVVLPRATVIPAGTPPDALVTMPVLNQTDDENMFGGVETAWIGEGDVKPATDFNLLEVELQPKELAAHIPMTDKLLRNWAAASTVAETQLRRALIGAQEAAFIGGSGSGRPQGFQHSSSGATIEVNRETADTVEYEDVVKMYESTFGTGLIWIGTRRVKGQLMRMTDGEGRLIWQPDARAGVAGTVLGIPFIEYHRGPQLGARGDLSLVDLSYYLIKQGSGPFVAFGYSGDDFVRNKQRIKIFTNVDGKPWLTAPLEHENGDEASPFVILDVPASS
ncbi:MAG: phage major capsid protein [Gammaproteobacteria bacterium]|nr:MAG: phage major capsid protein [Gammaproteobacteria bacterium]